MTIYLVSAVRTSRGPGPGVKTLPASEASALVGMKYAVYGSRAPNEPNPEPTVRRFGSAPPPPRPAHSNWPREAAMTVRTVSPADGSLSMSFAWGDGTEILTAGQLIDVEPGGALETAIGSANLTPLSGQALAAAANGGAGAVSN